MEIVVTRDTSHVLRSWLSEFEIFPNFPDDVFKRVGNTSHIQVVGEHFSLRLFCAVCFLFLLFVYILYIMYIYKYGIYIYTYNLLLLYIVTYNIINIYSTQRFFHFSFSGRSSCISNFWMFIPEFLNHMTTQGRNRSTLVKHTLPEKKVLKRVKVHLGDGFLASQTQISSISSSFSMDFWWCVSIFGVPSGDLT